MPLPATWSMVTVTGEFLGVDGGPLKGSVTFTSTTRLADPVGNVIVPPTAHRATLDKDGRLSVSLPATDDPDAGVTGWAYQVAEDLVLPSGQRVMHSYQVLLPSSPASVDLADLAPVTPVGEVSPYVRHVDLGAYVPRRDASYLARGAVMFSLDDGQAQNADLVALHEAYGQRITLGVVSDWVDDPGRLTSAQVLDFHQRGHEIANHTKTHANYTSATAAQRATESDTCSDFIEALTGVRPVTFIYPQGAWSATTDRELYTRFRSWAATLSPGTNLPAQYPIGDTCPRFYRVDLDAPGNLERAKDLVRLAAVSPVVVSFYTHWTDQPGVLTTAQYQSVAQLAYGLGVPAVLPRDMFGGFSALADPSFETAGLPTWFPTFTGAASGGRRATAPDAGISGSNVLEMVAANPDSVTYSQPVVLKPGVTYRVSGRVKVAAGNLVTNDFGVRLKYRNWDETVLSQQIVFPALSANGVWARFETDMIVPVGARFAWFDLLNLPGTAGRSGTLHVDHVDVRPAEQGGMG